MIVTVVDEESTNELTDQLLHLNAIGAPPQRDPALSNPFSSTHLNFQVSDTVAMMRTLFKLLILVSCESNSSVTIETGHIMNFPVFVALFCCLVLSGLNYSMSMGNAFFKKRIKSSNFQFFWFVYMFYIKNISKLVLFWVWLQEMYAKYMSITRKITKQQFHWFEQLIQRTCGPTLSNKKHYQLCKT